MAEQYIIILKELGKVPLIKKAFISSTSGAKELTIECQWSFKNYVNNEENGITVSYNYDAATQKSVASLPSIQDKRIIFSLTSNDGLKSAFFIQKEETSFLNIIAKSGQTFSINLKDEDKHGKVYNDEDLSGFCWSPDDSKIAFVAEKKRPKTSSYLTKKTESSNEGWGNKYLYIDDWGEQLSGQHESVVVIVENISSESTLRVLSLPEDFCGADVSWIDERTLVGVAYVTSPFRLGLKYCFIRESVLFQIDLDGNFKELTDRGHHVQSPRFNNDRTELVYLRGPAQGPHISSVQLVIMNWQTKLSKVVVDVFPKEVILSDGNSFNGLCGATRLPYRCWSPDGREVVFSTPLKHAVKTFCANVDSGIVRSLGASLGETCSQRYACVSVLDTFGGWVLLAFSFLTEAPFIAVSSWKAGAPLLSVSPRSAISDMEVDCWSLVNPTPHPMAEASDLPIPSIFLRPTQMQEKQKLPLAVLVHGGPHSMVSTAFSVMPLMLARAGFAVLMPNYRGSIGQGDLSIRSLPGNCSITDRDDVYEATLHCLQKYESVLDKTRVVLSGGSHGGFVVTHLSSKYPELYKVVSTRNPALDMISKVVSTDIPDWNFVESGTPYTLGAIVSSQTAQSMLSVSAIRAVDSVRAPTLLMLGTEDRRVHISQGMAYHKLLLARKVPTKALIYDDCHTLSKPDVEADTLIQTLLWFNKYI